MHRGFGKLVATAVNRAGLAAVASILSTAVLAEPSLTPHTAEYKVKISILSGELNTELKATEIGYIATHVIRPTGISRLLSRGTIRESSEFIMTPDGVRPTHFVSADNLSRDKTHAVIDFDWEIGEARGIVDDEEVVSIMEELAYDRVSIQYELMHDLLHGGPSEQYILFDIDKLKTINVRIIGQRQVSVPAGKFDAIGVQHQATGSKRITTMWCVEALGFLPVIIEQHRKGKLRVRAVLRKYSPIQS